MLAFARRHMSHLDIKALRQDRVQRETAVSKSETGASVLQVRPLVAMRISSASLNCSTRANRSSSSAMNARNAI